MQPRDPLRLKKLLININQESIDDLKQISQGIDHFLSEIYSQNQQLLLLNVKKSAVGAPKTMSNSYFDNMFDTHIQKIQGINNELVKMQALLNGIIKSASVNQQTAQNLETEIKNSYGLNHQIGLIIAKLSFTLEEIKTETQEKQNKTRIYIQKEVYNSLMSQLTDLIQHNQSLRSTLQKESGIAPSVDSAKRLNSLSLDPNPGKKSNFQP